MPTEVSPDLFTRVQFALQQWRAPLEGESPLAGLHLYQRDIRRVGVTARSATNAVLELALDVLKQSQPQDATLLRFRYIDDRSVAEAAQQLNLAESAIYPRQRKAIHHLCAIIEALEAECVAHKKSMINERLGAPVYGDVLVGLDESIEQLAPLLTRAEPPWIVAIEGIGGIGKTTLADVLARRLAQHPYFDGAAWVSAQSHLLALDGSIRLRSNAIHSTEAMLTAFCRQIVPHEAARYLTDGKGALRALRRHLQKAPHLLVCDNLETFEDLDALMPALSGLANPSKILLTSRQRYAGEFSIFHTVVPELSEHDSLLLLRREGERLNLAAVANATDRELRPIYSAVGGNPLALRLVAGQLHRSGIGRILDDLRQAHSKGIDNLYTYIYWEAWSALSEMERRVFLVMPLVPLSGNSADAICNICREQDKIELDDVHAVLGTLVRLNLVEVGGTLHERLFHIHSLTRTFLEKEVLKC